MTGQSCSLLKTRAGISLQGWFQFVLTGFAETTPSLAFISVNLHRDRASLLAGPPLSSLPPCRLPAALTEAPPALYLPSRSLSLGFFRLSPDMSDVKAAFLAVLALRSPFLMSHSAAVPTTTVATALL